MKQRLINDMLARGWTQLNGTIAKQGRWYRILVISSSISQWIIVTILYFWMQSASSFSIRSERFMIYAFIVAFISCLILFHMIAWLGKDWITLRFVRAIDYLYLSAAAVGLAISALRQSIEHSQYAALWFPTVIWWLPGITADQNDN